MKKIFSFSLLIVLALVFAVSCGGGKSGESSKNDTDNVNDEDPGRKQGELYGECYPNGTCNKGLVCDEENNICIKDPGNTEEPEDDTDKDDGKDDDDTDTSAVVVDDDTDTDSPDTTPDHDTDTDQTDPAPDEDNDSDMIPKLRKLPKTTKSQVLTRLAVMSRESKPPFMNAVKTAK